MQGREQIHIHESCVVPFRRTELGVEFCLVTPIAANRWEFPGMRLNGDQFQREALLASAAAAAGLQGRLLGSEPIGQFVAARGNEVHSMVAHLMQVTGTDDEWPQQSTRRRLWCLAEEARVRLRRKPLRRFVDAALHLIEAHAGPITRLNSHAPAAQRV